MSLLEVELILRWSQCSVRHIWKSGIAMFRKKQSRQEMAKLNIKEDGILKHQSLKPDVDPNDISALILCILELVLDTLGLDSIDIVGGPRFDFSKCSTKDEWDELLISLEDYIIFDSSDVQIYVPNDCADKICYWLGILEEDYV